MEITVLSTYKILKEKAFNSDISEAWVDWAIEMIGAGYESENLYELAGISRPYNQFELHDLTSKVLKDLELDFSNKELTIMFIRIIVETCEILCFGSVSYSKIV
jgi:hypothetical protein